MKHWKILIPALVLALGLTACGGDETETQAPGTTAPASQAPVTEAPASQTPGTQAPVSGDATSSDLTDSGASRPAEGTLTYSVSGTEQQMAAELYDAADYTLYLPKEGWTVTEEDGKLRVEYTDNTADALEISFAAGADAAALKTGLDALGSFDAGEEITNAAGLSGTHYTGSAGDVHYSAYAFPSANGAVLVVIQADLGADGSPSANELLMEAMVDTLMAW
jgi:hypothetical protein